MRRQAEREEEARRMAEYEAEEAMRQAEYEAVNAAQQRGGTGGRRGQTPG